MNGKKFLSLLLAAALLLGLGGCSGKSKKPVYDRTGKYELDASGEALTTDIMFSSDYVTDDNCRVFYEIFVGSFSDSDGDGTGDLRGIINRMDYLNDGDPTSGKSLGIEGIWLTPVFKSPSYHKYDVTDYYEIDPAFGTMEDLQELISLCHERNVKIILDMPINHTGANHAWFANFRTAHMKDDTGNPYYDYYSWYSADQGEPIPGHTYSQIGGTDDYYECNFSGDMPELNFDNLEVRQAVLDIAKFYLDMGVDGFRFDAAKYIYFRDDGASTYFWFWYLKTLKEAYPDMYTVAEVWDSDDVTDRYFKYVNCFNFTVAQTNGMITEAAQAGNVNRYTQYVDEYLENVQSIRKDSMIVPFIANHDTDRAAGYLTEASGQMKVAANLYLLGPGSPFIYYGEEIGMRGSRGGANTDANRRLAMLWGDEDTVKDPEGTTYDKAHQTEYTVADQLGRGDSLLSYYKRLIMLRQANPEIARGDYTALGFADTKIGGFISEWNGSAVCVIHNTTGHSATVDLSQVTDLTFSEIAGCIGIEEELCTIEGTMLTIGAQTSVVLR